MRHDETTRVADREQAEATLNSIGDAVLSTDTEGRVVYLNLAAETMTGWSREAAVGRHVEEVFRLIDRGTRDVAPNPMTLAIRLNKTVGLAANCILVRPDGREIEIEDSAAPIYDQAGRVTGAVIVFRDVGIALETSRQMSHLAQHDALTGLPNRLSLNDRLIAAIALAHRRGKPLAVLFLDVDGFKAVNDSLGHAAADDVLRLIGARLTATLRQSDTVTRYGGDEFVIVLSEIEGAEAAGLVARKLLLAIAGTRRGDSTGLHLTASIGVSLYPDHGQDPATLVAIADAAMYEAKRAGAGSYRLATAPSESRNAEPNGGLSGLVFSQLE
jgi:diguanylate cyclase (GGDEF)-like protein/PAS domain S-box-containing protein